LEIIDLEAAKEKSVLVHRSPDGNCDAVAEHALGMLLTLANNLCTANADVRKKIWRREELRGWELMGKTIGIIGFGFTGTAFGFIPKDDFAAVMLTNRLHASGSAVKTEDLWLPFLENSLTRR
jgi:lactate dehydrogenase-like 2-hydroxyacid dehydrogenase